MKKKIEELMKNALPLEVPMEVGIGVGKNWLEAHWLFNLDDNP